ncbi:hypothetical protein LIER_39932 [Lithospermum erythrorhizon]|uniref:Encoded peptide n=1 Tax=Lithospermum erythrorhizon TaxID=34254 RepID=A0AAV3QM87_LITER
MAFSKMIYVAIFLIMIFLVEGRQLRVKKGEKSPILDQSERKTLVNNVDSIGKAEQTNVEAISSQMTPPSAGTTGAQPQPVAALPSPGHLDDFRPTTPGHSPGIGHSVHH